MATLTKLLSTKQCQRAFANQQGFYKFHGQYWGRVAAWRLGFAHANFAIEALDLRAGSSF
jgi:hypothetical protein